VTDLFNDPEDARWEEESTSALLDCLRDDGGKGLEAPNDAGEVGVEEIVVFKVYTSVSREKIMFKSLPWVCPISVEELVLKLVGTQLDFWKELAL
jgi:hypothetical protein